MNPNRYSETSANQAPARPTLLTTSAPAPVCDQPGSSMWKLASAISAISAAKKQTMPPTSRSSRPSCPTAAGSTARRGRGRAACTVPAPFARAPTRLVVAARAPAPVRRAPAAVRADDDFAGGFLAGAAFADDDDLRAAPFLRAAAERFFVG